MTLMCLQNRWPRVVKKGQNGILSALGQKNSGDSARGFPEKPGIREAKNTCSFKTWGERKAALQLSYLIILYIEYAPNNLG